MKKYIFLIFLWAEIKKFWHTGFLKKTKTEQTERDGRANYNKTFLSIMSFLSIVWLHFDQCNQTKIYRVSTSRALIFMQTYNSNDLNGIINKLTLLKITRKMLEMHNNYINDIIWNFNFNPKYGAPSSALFGRGGW